MNVTPLEATGISFSTCTSDNKNMVEEQSFEVEVTVNIGSSNEVWLCTLENM
jgi:hypothetical protein